MSTDANPSHYFSPAFYSQYNLILLGGSALFALASASPWPAVLGVAAELTWLSFGPRLPAFQRRIDERLAGERRARLDDEVMQGMRALSPEHTARLLAVGESISWIAMPTGGAENVPGLDAALLELEALRPAFLRACQLRERLLLRLEELRQSPPEREVAELSRAYAAEKDLGERFTLHQAIKSAQKKVEQQQRFADVRYQIDTKLLQVEEALVQLRQQQQQGFVAGDPVREIQNVLRLLVLIPAFEAEFG